MVLQRLVEMHHFAHGYQVRTLRAPSVACISHTAARPSQTEPKFAFFLWMRRRKGCMAAPIACSQPWLPGSCRPSRIAFVMSRASSQSTPKRFSPSLSTVLTAVSHAHCSQAKVSTASRSRSTACKTSSYTPGCGSNRVVFFWAARATEAGELRWLQAPAHGYAASRRSPRTTLPEAMRNWGGDTFSWRS